MDSLLLKDRIKSPLRNSRKKYGRNVFVNSQICYELVKDEDINCLKEFILEYHPPMHKSRLRQIEEVIIYLEHRPENILAFRKYVQDDDVQRHLQIGLIYFRTSMLAETTYHLLEIEHLCFGNMDEGGDYIALPKLELNFETYRDLNIMLLDMPKLTECLELFAEAKFEISD